MPLAIGSWSVNVAGREGDLVLTTMNSQTGVVEGTILQRPFQGFWNEVDQSLTMSVTLGNAPGVGVIATFDGYLLRTPPDPEPGRDVIASLTGSVYISHGVANIQTAWTWPESTARRHTYGWFAHITEIA